MQRGQTVDVVGGSLRELDRVASLHSQPQLLRTVDAVAQAERSAHSVAVRSARLARAALRPSPASPAPTRTGAAAHRRSSRSLLVPRQRHALEPEPERDRAADHGQADRPPEAISRSSAIRMMETRSPRLPPGCGRRSHPHRRGSRRAPFDRENISTARALAGPVGGERPKGPGRNPHANRAARSLPPSCSA